MILILLQNDLGTTLVLCAIIGVMLVSSITWRILAPIFITVAVLEVALF